MSDRAPLYVHLLPSLIPHGALRGGVAVVIDVLRATTVMAHALAAGCEAIVPCGEIDEALDVARSLPTGTALLCGERGGRAIEGFDLGNSPADFTADRCRGRTLAMTTTNGTRAILASLEADEVFTGAFANRAALVRRLRRELQGPRRRPVHLVCAGTDQAVSLEDTLLAGALVDDLEHQDTHPHTPLGNDPALLARLAWLQIREAADSPNQTAIWLRQGAGGRNVAGLDLEADIDDSARDGHIDLVPRLERDPLRLVAEYDR